MSFVAAHRSPSADSAVWARPMNVFFSVSGVRPAVTWPLWGILVSAIPVSEVPAGDVLPVQAVEDDTGLGDAPLTYLGAAQRTGPGQKPGQGHPIRRGEPGKLWP